MKKTRLQPNLSGGWKRGVPGGCGALKSCRKAVFRKHWDFSSSYFSPYFSMVFIQYNDLYVRRKAIGLLQAMEIAL